MTRDEATKHAVKLSKKAYYRNGKAVVMIDSNYPAETQPDYW